MTTQGRRPFLMGERIRERRLAKGWSIRELAKLSGVTNGYISLLERGKLNNPTLDTLEKLAWALGMPLHALTGIPDPGLIGSGGSVGYGERPRLSQSDYQRLLTSITQVVRDAISQRISAEGDALAGDLARRLLDAEGVLPPGEREEEGEDCGDPALRWRGERVLALA